MDQVRGRRPQSASERSPLTDPGAQQPAPPESRSARPRRFWDVRGKVADDLARVPTPAATAWPAPLAGLIAGFWAAAMSWLLFAGIEVLGWVFAPLGTGTFADVMRASGATWVLANGGAIEWQGAALSLPPLAATAVIALFQRRAGGWLVGATDATDPRRLIAPYAFAVGAAVSAQLLAAATIANASLMPVLARSAVGAGGVALLGLGWGITRAVVLPLPAVLAHPFRVGRRFLALLSLSALLLVLLSAVIHHRAFLDVLDAVAADTTSKAQVLLLCLAYLPTLVGWALACLLGPGFTLGIGTGVSLGGVDLGALPPVPLLALVPEAIPGWAPLLLLLPALIALFSTAGDPRAQGWRSTVLGILLAGVGVALAALVVSGGMGPGRLVHVGPVWWQVAAAGAGWLALGHLFWWGLHAIRDRMADAPEIELGAAGKLAP